ncbi:DUF342 domain-containing protein [Halobacillus salinus]|uniref:DUF342 domain-containing protein n=1 Tax=Halobacillus salinus TaxID=192814 RepID=A0A4Z0H3U0_9BACI|nr:FapA family protein [Halobacillus salinus]TGB04780.1 DUF342 domain-containing protein [Halobacillus salinus]
MELHKHFKVSVSHDKLEAYLDQLETYEKVTEEELQAFLEEHRVSYGILEEEIGRIIDKDETIQYPLLIAQGKFPVHGKDGTVIYDKEVSFEINEHDRASFRDIISIPSVVEGERIAAIKPPTNGILGRNVHGEELPFKPGKPAQLKAGKNTTFKRSDDALYANIAGQLSADERSLQVQPLFEVEGNLDLRTGNLDFIGSIIIKGNVPTGFKVFAQGDITVYGLVEGANVVAGGSVYVSEGISGLGKGIVQAGHDIRAGYINQATVEAGQDLFVENSILHSDVVAHRSVYCQTGHIIGGTTSSGLHIEAKDIGNRLNTPTGLYLGVNKKVEEKQAKYSLSLRRKEEEKRKLVLIGYKLEEKEATGNLSAQDRVMKLRQRNSLQVVLEEIAELSERLEKMRTTIGDLSGVKVIVNGKVYGQVHLGFGKYQHQIRSEYREVQAFLAEGEIILRSLSS